MNSSVIVLAFLLVILLVVMGRAAAKSMRHRPAPKALTDAEPDPVPQAQDNGPAAASEPIRR